MNLTSMEVSIFELVFKPEIILNENTLLDLYDSSDDTQPHSIIV